MPETKIIFYKDHKSIPIIDWFEEISRIDNKAVEKCFAQLKLLKMFGHELHRPYADYLREGIYELRISHWRIQYRVLYFFHGQNVVILTNGLIKEGKVPESDIEKAKKRRIMYESNPNEHTFHEEEYYE